ncbi:MAG: hypothetical protein JWM11_5553 [Planctomycetaceae bacterium]|nr:hypothetical protein [Planctomycetaceae bacterium]
MWISRRPWIVFCCLIVSPVVSSQLAFGQVATPRKTEEPVARAEFGYVGAGSCSAAGCHGGNGTRPKFALATRSTEDFSAYSTWIQKDQHARAYQVLLEDKSLQIHRLLGKGWKPPHQEARCLSCHATSAVAATTHDPVQATAHDEWLDQERLSDGVSCEACHGPAKNWLVPHTLDSWRSLASEERKALGFQDLRHDLVARAQTCAECHVGGPGRDVNHDLIAAGHPRLYFELAAYHANMPAHWSNEKDRQTFRPPAAEIANAATASSLREAKLWLVGQLATSEAALNLLESRARAAAAGHGAWPEFSEYSCYACHHDLQSPSWRQKSSPLSRTDSKPGSYPWGTWTFPLLATLKPQPSDLPWDTSLKELQKAMGRPTPAPADVLTWTAASRNALTQELAQHVTPVSLTVAQLRELLQRVTHDGQELSSRDWDGAAQTYLATLSLYQASLEASGTRIDMKRPVGQLDPIQRSLITLREKLSFPNPPDSQQRLNSPRNFDTNRIQVIQNELRRIEELVKRPELP